MMQRVLWMMFVFACQGITSIHSVRAVEDSAHVPARPAWIWHAEDRQPGQAATFTKSFTIDAPVTSAVLRCLGESAGFVISLDGQTIADVEPYDPILRLDVANQLRPGNHRLSVAATSVAGPAALFVALEIGRADGSLVTVVSDHSWSAESRGESVEVVQFGAVDERLVIPRDRQIGIKAVDNYEQWKQALAADRGTNPASFLIADDFEVQRVRSAQPQEDSWVSLAFDRRGRAIIAKEKQGLLRMTLSAAGDHVTKTEVINDSLLECRGILPVGRHLYVNANNSKALYRITGDADGNYGEPAMILATTGGVGHGRNDLALGPDGKIYSIHGDSVRLPPAATDHTSPFRDARRGKPTSEGHLLRIDPNSGGVEILAAGLRNPFGIDFNSHGDVFTYDADAEHDMGSPWYRPTRVDHLVTGGDYGWRGVTGTWPPYYPDHADNARPNLDIGKGSPTAVKFGTRSSFPPRYRDALFILDWAYGRIIAVHAVPRGASYVMSAERFLKGRPLNVTDLDFGPDGAMYFVTGGRKTQSALYRVRYVGKDRTKATPPTDQQQARHDFAQRSRTLRRELEATLLLEPDSNRLAEIWGHLNNPDPWVRHAAVNLVERYPLQQWADRALQEKSVTPAAATLLALARSQHHEWLPAVVARLNELPIEQASRSDQLAALQAYSSCLANELADPRLLAAAQAKLAAMYPNDSSAVNRLLSELLVYLGDEQVIDKTLRLLSQSSDQAERMHYLYVLRNLNRGWSLQQRRTYFSALADAKHYLGGAGMPGFLEKIRSESIETLTAAEQSALADMLNDAPERSTIEPPQPREFVREWTVAAVMSLGAEQHKPDLRRGAELFRAASCANCHRVAGTGTLVGPDLTKVSSRFNRRDLLKSIIEPSAVIAENYRSLQIVTVDGSVHIGQTALGGDYRSPVLRLATDPQQPLKTIEIAKSEIESQRYSPVSWMPKGLLDTLSHEEILDLIAFIESGGQE
jgi:putative heme-binding domain-containing protein